jgi:hypothetical protein
MINSEMKMYIEEIVRDYSFEENVFNKDEFITNCNKN